MEYFLMKHEIGNRGFLFHAELIIMHAKTVKMHYEKTNTKLETAVLIFVLN